jgi:large subunit ribosomal protein L10
MAITKKQKAEIEGGLAKIVKDSASVVFVAFDKLAVADVNSIRRALQTEGVGYVVAKKTLAKRALVGSAISGEMPVLDGQLALVYGKDPIAPARAIHAFVKKFKEQLKIVGGVFEGSYRDKAAMMSIATIPPLNILRGQFLNVINSPIQGLAIALNQIAEKKIEKTN